MSQTTLSKDERSNINGIAGESVKFKPKEGRYDPFADDHILKLVQDKAYSPFLKKFIENLEEAAWHSKYLTEQWAQEDEIDRIEHRRLQNNKYQKEFQERKRKQAIPPEVAAARTAWKVAIAQRNTAMGQWGTYISQLNKHYLTLKLDSANKATEQINVVKELSKNES